MKVEELYDELATGDSHLAHLQQADNADYEVVVSLDLHQDRVNHIRSLSWDHGKKRFIIELE